jgi:DNA-binding LacI/PurR family transcriptional regulator
MGAIRVLKDFNLRVPEDVSVICFYDIKAVAFTLPRLTTINQPLEEIGRVATQRMLNRIHSTIQPRDEITVEPELVVRETTGPLKTTGSSR